MVLLSRILVFCLASNTLVPRQFAAEKEVIQMLVRDGYPKILWEKNVRERART